MRYFANIINYLYLSKQETNMDGYTVKWFDDVASTNSEMARNKRNLENFTTYAATFQSSGRGQKGNVWLSERGMNLTFSTLAKPEGIHVSEQFSISQATALAITDYLDGLGIKSDIKWPNDIYVGKRKLCGILIENSLDGEFISSSIIGVGLNVNQTSFGAALPNPVSISMLTGKTYDIRRELQSLLGCIHTRISAIESGRYRNSLDVQYMERLFRRGMWHDFERMEQTDIPVEKRKGHLFSARILGVDSSGKLLLENRSGVVESYAFKEIKYIT